MRPSVKTRSAETTRSARPSARTVADDDAALSFERFLPSGDLESARESSGNGDVREIEERGDVGDREVRGGDVEVEADVSFAGHPVDGSVERECCVGTADDRVARMSSVRCPCVPVTINLPVAALRRS